jgi:hypothetical protein
MTCILCRWFDSDNDFCLYNKQIVDKSLSCKNFTIKLDDYHC